MKNTVEESTLKLKKLADNLGVPRTNTELYYMAMQARKELERAKNLNAEKLVQAWADMSAELDKAYRAFNIGLIMN